MSISRPASTTRLTAAIRARRATRSVRVLVYESGPERHGHNLEVELQGPVLDVVEIVLDALLDRRIPAPAVHLSPSRNAGLDLVAQHVPRHAIPKLLDENGSLRSRPDDGHIALQHVDKLGKLIQGGAAKDSTYRCRPIFAGSCPHRPRLRLRIDRHRAKLQDFERLTIEAHALLAVKHGPGRRELHRNRDE